VLRIDKGRFQMFGDTVNYASRMESTGACGRVQVSEAAAALLANTPGVRLEARGMVEVKGKGQVPTFWLHRADDCEPAGAELS
jgi:atrial natriuretic peptide receptor A